jgi:hypothetical protein
MNRFSVGPNQQVRRIGDTGNRRCVMKKLLLAAMMALSMGMGVASAATADHPNWPTVEHNGPPASTPGY